VINYNAYLTSKLREKENVEIDRLLNEDNLEQVKFSEWVSSIVIVPT